MLMTKRNKTIAVLTIIIIITVVSYMIYLEAFLQVDQDLIEAISVAGIHLLDSEVEVRQRLGKGIQKAGCMGPCGLYEYYPNQKITVATSGENHRVNLLVIHDNSHSILGIRVGDSFQTAIPKLQMHGLVPIRKWGKFTYHKEDLVIYFNVDDHHKISEINLRVRETTNLLPVRLQPIY